VSSPRARAPAPGSRSNLCVRIRFSGHGTQDGALREFMAWPSHLLHPLPGGVSDAAGAVLEPLGVAVHALDLGHVRFGATVAVAGCGPIGLLLIQVLRAAGVAKIVAFEPLRHRREAAVGSGADQVASPADVTGPDSLRELVADGADVTFEMAGTDDAVRLAMAAVRPGGRVVLGGIPGNDQTTFQASVARRKGLTIAMVRRMNEVYPRAIALAAAGKVTLGPLVTHRFGLDKVAEAFGTAAQRTGLKVLIEPGT
jgi:L-iditol 2-dehydrogenase